MSLASRPLPASPVLSGLYIGSDGHRSGVLCAGLLPSRILVFPTVGPGQARDFLHRSSVDFLLLDGATQLSESLPVLRTVSNRHGIPLVTVLPTTDEAHRIWALDHGSDDCVSHPCSLRELAARIRARVRRARGDLGPCGSGILGLGSLRIDRRTVSVHDGKRTIRLTHVEYRILEALVERVGRPLSREMLIALVRGTSTDVLDRSIDVHIFRLRQKLEPCPSQPRFIKTLRGGGYVAVPNHGP